jgi:hypothetical protein
VSLSLHPKKDKTNPKHRTPPTQVIARIHGRDGVDTKVNPSKNNIRISHMEGNPLASSFVFSPSKDRSRRSHLETRLLVRLLPQHFQLIELTRHFGQDVSHRTRLFEHAVLERPHHVADRKGGDAGLAKQS